MNIIQFPNKKKEYQDKLEKQRMKDTVNLLIDNCDGEFCIVFKTEDIGHLFDSKLDSEFTICTTNIKNIDSKNDEYFFSNFTLSKKQYFKLKE